MTTAQTVTSMTGFAQTEGHLAPFIWRLELKSVNSKGFDLRCRVPNGFDAFETLARTSIAQKVKRGALSLSLQIKTESVAASAHINRPLLQEVLSLAAELGETTKLDHILAVRGVIEVEETTLEPTPALMTALNTGLHEALDKLVTTRQSEGQHLLSVLTTHLDEVVRLTAAARAEAATIPTTLRDRLHQTLADLLQNQPALSPERLLQEAALLATKADITEELNRLEGHIAAVRDLLKDGGAIGRKLDFLCQELNREANTLCSKSETLTLTRLGVDLKVVIEQIREQVQNVE